MSKKIRSMLEEKIAEEIGNLSTLQSGSKEMSMAVDDVTKLYKLHIDELKTELEFEERVEKRESENEQFEAKLELDKEMRQQELDLKAKQLELEFEERTESRISDVEQFEARIELDEAIHEFDKTLKTQQLDEGKLDRYVKVGADVIGVVVPLVFYASWMKKGLRFEETGTFTSTTFKNLIGRFKTTK
ncbi:MAG: hypothetical protein R3Y53_01820 [Bacillota bacterium]